MGTLHTVRYRQPQTQSLLTPGLSHNGLLLYVGSPGVSLPDGPVHGLLWIWGSRWLLRLRLGRRNRSGIRRLRARWVGNALRRLRTWTGLWLRTRTRTRSGHCPSYRSRHALPGWYWQSGLLSHHHVRLLG